MNDAWETDNDADKDVNSLPDQFDGFRKGFLLEQPDPDRGKKQPT
jgi:hypothetical protein